MMNTNPFAVARPPGVAGFWDDVRETGVLDVLYNRYILDLRWNPYTRQWVPEGFENVRPQPSQGQYAPGFAPTRSLLTPLLFIAAGGLVLYLVLRRK